MASAFYREIPSAGSGHAEETKGSQRLGGSAITPAGGSAQRSIFEAAALAALARAQAAAATVDTELAAAANALVSAGYDDERDCHRVLELHRLTIHRMKHLVHAVSEAKR